MSWRIVFWMCLFLGCAVLLPAQRVRIFLKGGGELIATEYKVDGDRIRYYSVERSQWEEIPTEIVDLERTEQSLARKMEIKAERDAEDARLRTAERKARTELHNVPLEDGVYYRGAEKVELIAQAVVKERVSKRRSIFAKLTPVPMVAGKRIQALEGEQAGMRILEPKPVFYLRLETLSRFGIVRLETNDKKGERVVQVIASIPQSDEIFEQQDDVEVFRQQLAPTVYRVWPVDALQPGEYAVVDYVPGQDKLRVWDFAVTAAGG